ncbi:hypothetical protein [Flavobacterium sp. XGLA_31]|uniref:hypothetical protein n=1 Tax=Flavobacterium sp. XGLA_31 TaxID=3447666 RepID=UPI003F39FC8B
MKPIIFTVLFLAYSLANSQTKEVSEEELYKKAEADVSEFDENYYTADSTKLSQKVYDSYSSLSKKFPQSKRISYYLYNKGCFAVDKEESKKCFKEVIQINDWQYYVRQSYVKLSWIAVSEKEFDIALKYLDIIGKMENPRFTCGNEMQSYYAQLKNIRERCETGLKK